MVKRADSLIRSYCTLITFAKRTTVKSSKSNFEMVLNVLADSSAFVLLLFLTIWWYIKINLSVCDVLYSRHLYV